MQMGAIDRHNLPYQYGGAMGTTVYAQQVPHIAGDGGCGVERSVW